MTTGIVKEKPDPRSLTKVSRNRYNVVDKKGNHFYIKGSEARAKSVRDAGPIRRKVRDFVK